MTLELTKDEADMLAYALLEMSNRRREQAIERPMQRADLLREVAAHHALADKLSNLARVEGK